jgi:hypothetical protein
MAALQVYPNTPSMSIVMPVECCQTAFTCI